MLGMAREDVGNLAGAEQAYLRYLEVDSNKASAWSNLGNLRFRKQNFTGALEAFERAVILDHQSESIWSMLGHARGILGDGWGSVTAFQRAVELTPEKAEAWAALAYALEEDHRFAEAKPAWERAAALGDPSARDWLQRIRQLGMDPLSRFAGQDDIKPLVAGALRSVPRNPDLYGSIRIGDANWYMDSKGPEMVKLNSNGHRWVTASEWLTEIGMLREAEFAIRVALLCAPQDVGFLLRLAQIQHEQNLLKEASDTLEEVLSRQPENPIARDSWNKLQALFKHNRSQTKTTESEV